jgi:hypothetical protein
LLVAVAGVTAMLAFAGTALATYSPKLVVASSGDGHARIGVVAGASDDPTAKTSIYIPNGFGVATPAPGTTLGSVTATAAAADLGGAVLPLTGSLIAIAPNATTIADSQSCGVDPTQTWDLHLSAAGQTLDIPLFVVNTVGPEAAAGFVSKLVVCLPPPDVPVGSPNRAVFGAKLLSATFTSSAIIEPSASGDYRWTSLWTPYTPNTGKPNAAGTVEVQAIRHLPIALSTHVTRKKLTRHKTVKVHGKRKTVKVISTSVHVTSTATENGLPAAATITTTAGGKRVGAAAASFTLAAGKSAKIVVTARIDSTTSVSTGTPVSAADLFYSDLGAGACTPTAIFQGLPCTDATVGGETLVKTTSVVGYH